ncbi:hypothetical protein [Natronorubrum sulfidifaciens]|uniref:Uncharacterized protein n=1 Tax=Natronorubrum sulfidifaciens JCM 14089 TaxID=1230460 RepID=L9WK60_9EURY|nr:hypothetical protein [Natronorubrum sulfidifaciens]ELY49571.1 hypothetical protein C495_00040 [Natronorubrum sulfidifaciens JCM 14089]
MTTTAITRLTVVLVLIGTVAGGAAVAPTTAVLSDHNSFTENQMSAADEWQTTIDEGTLEISDSGATPISVTVTNDLDRAQTVSVTLEIAQLSLTDELQLEAGESAETTLTVPPNELAGGEYTYELTADSGSVSGTAAVRSGGPGGASVTTDDGGDGELDGDRNETSTEREDGNSSGDGDTEPDTVTDETDENDLEENETADNADENEEQAHDTGDDGEETDDEADPVDEDAEDETETGDSDAEDETETDDSDTEDETETDGSDGEDGTETDDSDTEDETDSDDDASDGVVEEDDTTDDGDEDTPSDETDETDGE